MTVHLRAAVYANVKDICRVQETSKAKELSRSRKSLIDSEEQVLKIIAAIKEYKHSFTFSSARKSKLKNIIRGSVASSENLSDISEAKAIGKEHLDYISMSNFLKKRYPFRVQ